jgi:uncharacterized membrane protein YkvA (DUF1232 family)
MIITRLKSLAQQLKQQTLIVYFAARDPRTPVLARILALMIAAYALSPIDLIPDFIPVLGYLDELVLLPLGLALVLRLIPADVLISAHAQADQVLSKPTSYAAAICIVVVWLLLLWASVSWVHTLLRT